MLQPELIKKSSSRRRVLIVSSVVVTLFFASFVLVKLFIPHHFRLPDFVDVTTYSHLIATDNQSDFHPHRVSFYHHVKQQKPAFRDNSVIISTGNGKIKGIAAKVLNKDILIALGIPYAKPPIKELRFRKPEPIESWTEVRDASRFGPQCIQFKPNRTWTPWISGDDYMSEDCLYLNIWAPLESSVSQSLKPVMVWIHGGAFFSGSSDLSTYDGRILAAYGDVVVVSINYRLGAFGFLNMGTESAPGNQGLHDQVMALRWIQTNIKNFGGDPRLVTLFGQSAGAISIGLHYLSPLSSDLFRRGILQSGAPTVTRLFYEREGGYGNRGVTLARMLDCLPENQPDTHLYNNSDAYQVNQRRDNARSMEDAVECLKTANIQELSRAQDSLIDEMSLSFGPTLGDDFLPGNPISLMDIGEIGEQQEVLLGATRDEGTFFLHYLDPKLFGNTLNNVSHSRIMQFVRESFPFLSPRVASVVFSQFLPIDENTSPIETRQILSDFIGDSTFTCPLTLFAQLFQKTGNKAYFYIFDHKPSNSPWPEWMGILHFDEVQFIFGVPLRYPQLYTAQEVEFSKKLIQTWVSYARNG